MPWLQIILLILKLLKEAKQANSAETFAASSTALTANGDLLKLLWEHRQEIIDFIMSFFKTPQMMGSTETQAEINSLVEDLKQ